MIIVLYDTPLSRQQFYPFSITRPLAHLHTGCMHAQQRWQLLMGQQVHVLSVSPLGHEIPASDKYLCIDATVVATKAIAEVLQRLDLNDELSDEYGLVAYATNTKPQYGQTPIWPGHAAEVTKVERRRHATELMGHNASQIVSDLQLLKPTLKCATGAAHNTVLGGEFYLSDAASLTGAIINTMEGPVVVDDGALIMEGTCIRGPVYIGKNAVVKMGSMIYGGTSIFNKCTVGGEIKNAILHPFSNKAHHGYLGDSVIGSWCNLGAGTSNSNIKNTAGEVMVFDESVNTLRAAGKKAGVFMGDYTRCAVNTRFNTGTTVGVCCSLHMDSIPPSHVASFTYGINETYRLPEALAHINAWMHLKGEALSKKEQTLIEQAHLTHAATFKP